LDRTAHVFHSLFLALALRMTIVATVSIVVALFTWNIIEKPMLGLRRYFSSSRDTPTAGQRADAHTVAAVQLTTGIKRWLFAFRTSSDERRSTAVTGRP
jgi:hypothetical protein